MPLAKITTISMATPGPGGGENKLIYVGLSKTSGVGTSTQLLLGLENGSEPGNDPGPGLG